MKKEKQIVNSKEFSIMIERLSHQLLENHSDFSDTLLVAIQPRGTHLAQRIVDKLKYISGKKDICFESLDITFFRDDFRRREEPIQAQILDMTSSIEDKKVVLIDDVLFTGRSVRSALNALMNFGRPKKIELMVLIDRRLKRHVPIQPDYIGKSVDSIFSERVLVKWDKDYKKDEIKLFRS